MRSKFMILSILLAVFISAPTFAQMYNQQTVYTDLEVSEGSSTLHAWGYTYAPSGNYLLHTYNTHTQIILPSGLSSENWASGSGYSPAVANVYITVPIDDLINGIEGDINLTSNHTAYCPGAGTNFLNTTSLVYPRPRITITTARYDGKIGDTCIYVPACSFGTPTCGSQSVYIIFSGNTCCGYVSVYFVRAFGTCFGIGANYCTWAPGPCT